MQETKAVFNMSRSNDLIRMGNNLIRIERSNKNKYINVYIFERTDKLLKDISTLATKFRK
ncbi:MAG: hypothetical protein ACRCXT_07585 [Paraclostridium sp.]